MTPKARATTLFRKQGFTVEDVEIIIPHANRRRDFGGFADLMLYSRSGIIAVQITTATYHVAHVKKSLASPSLHKWLGAGGGFWLFSLTDIGAWRTERFFIDARMSARTDMKSFMA